MKTWDKLELLIEELGAEEVLDGLCRAMSDRELNENLDYIARMFDIELENEE